MRRPIVISLLVAGLVAVTAGSASGERQGFLNVANGRYGFTGTAAGSTFNVYPFSFSVRGYADGSATGRYSYKQVRDGVELTVAGSLTCAVFRDDHLWVGGKIEQSSRASLIGLDMWFQVQDRSRGCAVRARHVVDDRRRRPRDGAGVLRCGADGACSRSSSTAATSTSAASPEGRLGAGPAPAPSRALSSR